MFLAGIGLALYARTRHPDRYELMGRLVLADSKEREDEPTEAA